MKKEVAVKRIIAGALTVVLTAGTLAGCSQREENALRDLDTDSYVTLCDYQNLSVSIEPIITDSEHLLSMMEDYIEYATLENSGITERAIVDGDIVNYDVVVKQDGVTVDNGSASGVFLLIGSDSYIDGFEDGLIGVLPGETVVLNLTFPQSYAYMELAGQEVEVTVIVNYIMEFRDEVVNSMGLENVVTVEEYQQYIYDDLFASKRDDYNELVRNAIMQELLRQCVYGELPEDILKSNKAYVTERVNFAAAYGLDADTYTQSRFNIDAETYINEYSADLTKQDITLQAIANREDLAVSDSELKKTLKQYAKEAGLSTVEEYLGDSSMEDYRNYIMTEKVMDYLAEHTQVSFVEE